MQQLDYLLGQCVLQIKLDNLMVAKDFLIIRIDTNEKDVARCKPISESEASKIIQKYGFNIGSALRHIFAFTRTIKKGSRPNKAELRTALKYINKEIERLSPKEDTHSEQN
jgi:hypothetical protein